MQHRVAIASINLKAEQKEGLNHIKMAKVTSDKKIFEKCQNQIYKII